MAKRDILGRLGKALTATPEALTLFRGQGGGFFAYPRSAFVDGAYVEVTKATYAHLYASQESVRTVVDYVARIAADRSLRCIRFQANGNKVEENQHPAAKTLREPNDWTEQKEMLGAFFRDVLVYDDAYLWDMGPSENGQRFLVRVPPHAMGVKSDNVLRPSGYRIKFANGTWLDLEPNEVIHFRGYSAGDSRIGVSPMHTLRALLAESAARQAQAVDQVRGGLVKGGIVSRPLEAPEWSNEAMERFSESFASRLRGIVSGQTPVLEEGMTFEEAGITPREAEMLESRKFALATVAVLYGLNPALFTTSGNLKDARTAAEEDVIAPLCGRVASVFTHQLLRKIYGDNDHAFKFKPKRETDAGKLFEAGSKATGGSTVTTNEFRGEFLDMPPVPGGDEIVKHPGSAAGGTPEKPGSEPRGRPPADDDIEETEKAVRAGMKALEEKQKRADIEAKSVARRATTKRNRDRTAADHAELFRNHFRRQQRSKASLHDERWNKELARDLLELGNEFVLAEGTRAARGMAGKFDMSQIENYMKAGARAVAEGVNKSTVIDYEEALERAKEAGKADDVDPRQEVLDKAIGDRSDQLGMTRATTLSSFALLEAGKQNSNERVKRVKMWVWSGAANSRHGGVASETADVFHEFSNGMQFPGDPAGGTHETARCQCALDVF